jgi:hypothetical protein
MSHFSVLVIGDDADTQFIPFEESGAPEEYLTFRDDEDEYLKKYNGSTEKVIMPDGRMLNPWDEEFRVSGTLGTGSDTHKVPEGLEIRQVPYKELFSSFEQYMSEYCGYEHRDEKTLRYGYWKNENAKWDYHRLGGRWRGFFKLKPGRTGVLTDASWDSSKESLRAVRNGDGAAFDCVAMLLMDMQDMMDSILEWREKNPSGDEPEFVTIAKRVRE